MSGFFELEQVIDLWNDFSGAGMAEVEKILSEITQDWKFSIAKGNP